MDLGSPAQQPDVTLEGVEWELEGYIGPDDELMDVPPEVLATANFADSRVSGSTGCNRYGGSYTIADDGTLSISEVVSTMMACLPEADAVERALLASFDRTVRAHLGVDRLSLIDADGRELLRFRPAVAPPLVGTEWVAIGINNGRGGVVSALEGARVTANFDDEGRVAGSGGCNRFMATFEVDGDTIRIGPVAGTRMMCVEPEGVSEQEASYVAALERASTWTIREGRLQLRDADGALQVDFSAADAA
jgi:heat shock protein HslJ